MAMIRTRKSVRIDLERIQIQRRCAVCESNVYVRDDEGEKLVMKDAVLLTSEAGKIKVADALGDEKEISGELEEITFLDHRIVIRGV